MLKHPADLTIESDMAKQI